MPSLKIGPIRIKPGQKKSTSWTIREGNKSVAIPLTVIHGRKPGKRMVIIANQHGTEINSIESARRYCAQINPQRVSGTIICVASANPMAALAKSACWGEGDRGQNTAEYQSRYNMNWIWPGKTGGLWVQKAVHEYWTKLILAGDRPADFVADMHCHTARSATYAENETQILLGVMSGVTAVVNTRTDEAFQMGIANKTHIWQINRLCTQNRILCSTIELKGQNSMTQNGIEDGVRALRNWTTLFGISQLGYDLPARVDLMDPWRTAHHPKEKGPPSFSQIKARKSGLLIPHKQTYEAIRKGELLCEVLDPHRADIVETCYAPMSGILYFATSNATCKKGDRIFTVASNQSVQPLQYFKKHGTLLAS